MLFNSYAFLLLFLPLTLAGFALVRRMSGPTAIWLIAASLIFYGFWNPYYVALVLVSILFNYLVSTHISSAETPGGLLGRRSLLAIGVASNLALLGYFKYANFFIGTLNQLAGSHIGFASVVLPLGISFFTFTQIAFLTEVYRREVTELSVRATFCLSHSSHISSQVPSCVTRMWATISSSCTNAHSSRTSPWG